ncbi:MAG TPA: hypothetical protein VKC51_05990 [Lacunisphaera sp.]|nr:hypothetical protein [Lacunisphaera sp.]
MEPDDPPPKVYGFKEREFKRDNAPGSPPSPTAKEHAIAAGHVVPATRKAPPSGGVNRTADPNDVYAVLQQNRAKENQFGLNEVQIKEIKSKRKRDFWLMLVGGNLLIIGLVFITGFNVVSVIFGLSGIIILSLSLTWIMWQVMNKY